MLGRIATAPGPLSRPSSGLELRAPGPAKRRGFFRGGLRLGGALLVLSFVSNAFAQGGGAAAAEVLFREGIELRRAGQTAEACEKFEESQRLDPAAGTLLNLGDCREAEGKLASAWALFEEARKTAVSDVVREEAAARASAVQERLSFLRIEVKEPVPEQVIRYGEVTLGRAAYGTRVPVDPGEVTVSASAPGYVTWTTQVKVEQGTLRVQVPALVPVTKMPDPPPPPAPPARSVGPWVLGASGVATLGVGLALGLVAKGHYDTADGLCPSHEECSDETMNEWNKADTLATTSTILVPIGALALTGGVVWWLMQSGEEKSGAVRSWPRVSVTPQGGFVTYRGEF